MNEDDLERDLRAHRGPREEGYAPASLPMTLEEQPAGGATPSRLGRAGLLVGVGVAGALAVAAVASILSGAGSGPEVGSGNSTAPSTAPTQRPAPACGIRDVALAAEPWGGAAGSRGTVVTVSLTPGRYACALPAVVYAQVVDANGVQLVTGRTPATSGSVALESGPGFTLGVAWSNWCGDEPAAPLNLLVAFGSGPPRLVGQPGSIPASAVPPCMGNGSSALSLTDLQSQP
jgi:hypothetical protein